MTCSGCSSVNVGGIPIVPLLGGGPVASVVLPPPASPAPGVVDVSIPGLPTAALVVVAFLVWKALR